MNCCSAHSLRLAHAISGAKDVFFAQRGHLPSYEEPDKYIEVLGNFLSVR